MPANLFSVYSTPENRVTASILAVFRCLSIDRVERLLSALLEEEFKLVRFENQSGRGGRGTPDGQIAASCLLLLETKRVRNALDREQIARHLLRLKDSNASSKSLLLLTPDANRPSIVDEFRDDSVEWASFALLYQAIDELLADLSEVVSEREAFLLRELQAMLSNEGLIESELDTVVVPARSAWPVYLKGHAYVCQPGRAFRSVKYVAFYRQNRIENLVPLIEEVRDNVLKDPAALDGRVRDAIQADISLHAEQTGQLCKVILLTKPDDPRTIRLTQPIENDIRSANGTRVAFTQSQRYVRSEDLKTARLTSHLASDA